MNFAKKSDGRIVDGVYLPTDLDSTRVPHTAV